MPMLGLDSDNGSEFINRNLYNYCQPNGIAFTRSRSYKNNDSCHVVSKLARKSRHGATVYRVYDVAQTLYQRLLKSGALTEAKKRELADIYAALNPVALLPQIGQSVDHLHTLAER
jgi:hypothetical protein